MALMPYDRTAAFAYAQRWAYLRNPLYADFNDLGGDCTNFISQCLYAGSGVMNFTPDVGWYYLNINQRSPAWTGVEPLYRFLTGNSGRGPQGVPATTPQAQVGDVIQLSFDGEVFSHSLLVVFTMPPGTVNDITIATHTMDSFDRPLSSYLYQELRVIHITGVGI